MSLIDFNYQEDGQMLLGDDGSVDTLEDIPQVVQNIKHDLSCQIHNFDWDTNYGIDRRVFYNKPIDDENVQTEVTNLVESISGVDQLISLSLGNVTEDKLKGKYLPMSLVVSIYGQQVDIDVPVSLQGEDIDAVNNI